MFENCVGTSFWAMTDSGKVRNHHKQIFKPRLRFTLDPPNIFGFSCNIHSRNKFLRWGAYQLSSLVVSNREENFDFLEVVIDHIKSPALVYRNSGK